MAPKYDDSGAQSPGNIDRERMERLVNRLAEREAALNAPPAQPWSPPEDPDKPSLPYITGFSAKIQRHYIDAATEFKPVLTEEYLKTITQSELVVLKPPTAALAPTELQTRMVAGTLIHMSQDKEKATASTTTGRPAETAQLIITKSIAIGAARGAQVVSCTVTPCHADGSPGPRQSFQAVAKIFDPLYYKFDSGGGGDPGPRNCVYDADGDYRTEAAAYEYLHAKDPDHKDIFVPEFYGSWTMALPITLHGKPQTRDVQLILIELLNGTSIESMRIHNNPGGTDAFHYPEEYRLEVLARALEGVARQLEYGLHQGDFAGRNIVLVTASTTTTDVRATDVVCGLAMPRVVLVDYNNAWITSCSTQSSPVDPGIIGQSLYLWADFGGWVPNEWMEWTDESGLFHNHKMDWLSKRFPAPAT